MSIAPCLNPLSSDPTRARRSKLRSSSLHPEEHDEERHLGDHETAAHRSCADYRPSSRLPSRSSRPGITPRGAQRPQESEQQPVATDSPSANAGCGCPRDLIGARDSTVQPRTHEPQRAIRRASPRVETRPPASVARFPREAATRCAPAGTDRDRTAISRCRAAARPRSHSRRFAQAMSSTSPTSPEVTRAAPHVPDDSSVSGHHRDPVGPFLIDELRRDLLQRAVAVAGETRAEPARPR